MEDFLLYTNIIIGTIFLTLCLTHIYIRKIELLSALDNYLAFKKFMFNKKIILSKAIEPKIIIVFYLISSFVIAVADTIFLVGISNILEGNEDINTAVFLMIILYAIVIIIIARLIFEFIIIPYYCTPRQPQYNIPNNQQMYTYTFTQQPQTQTPNMPKPNASQQQDNSSFVFCSQCGTRYAETDSACPNCGKK